MLCQDCIASQVVGMPRFVTRARLSPSCLCLTGSVSIGGAPAACYTCVSLASPTFAGFSSPRDSRLCVLHAFSNGFQACGSYSDVSQLSLAKQCLA